MPNSSSIALTQLASHWPLAVRWARAAPTGSPGTIRGRKKLTVIATQAATT